MVKKELESIISKLVKVNPIYKELLSLQPKHSQEVLNYFKKNESHQKLLNEYFPASNFNEQEIIKRTANRVGLNLPKAFEGMQEKTAE